MGTCDGALVGGVTLDLKPNTSLEFMKLGMLSPDGACKSFDVSGNGYCRAEGNNQSSDMCVFFIVSSKHDI